MFVRGVGFVRRRPHYDRWDQPLCKPAGSGEWNMFYADPIPDADPAVEMQHAVSFWRGRVEAYSEVLPVSHVMEIEDEEMEDEFGDGPANPWCALV